MAFDSAFGQWMANTFGSFDLAVFSGFAAVQNDIFTIIAKYMAAFGEPIFAIMFGLTSIVLCFFKRTRKIGILLVIGAGIFLIFNNFIFKYGFQRIRPYNALQWNSDFFNWYMNVGALPENIYCFPSGHTFYTTTMATIVVLWARNDMKKPEAWLIFLLPLLVGSSRIYLMVHYPTDVIAGFLFGLILGISVWYLYKLMMLVINKIFGENILDKIVDLEPWLEKKLKHKIDPSKLTSIIVLAVVCFSVVSGTKYFKDSSKEHCEHQGPDYICMNEGDNKVFDEASNEWKLYCDLHS